MSSTLYSLFFFSFLNELLLLLFLTKEMRLVRSSIVFGGHNERLPNLASIMQIEEAVRITHSSKMLVNGSD